MNEILTNLSKVLPALAILAVVFTFLGWSFRGSREKPVPAKSAKPAPHAEKGQLDRIRNLENSLENSKTTTKAMKDELESLKEISISKAAHQVVLTELEKSRSACEAEIRRTAALEVELKKAQDALRQQNTRNNESDKAQKDRGFTLQNELSKTREQLALLQDRPNDAAGLQEEIARLRESVATSTRFAGELRKRETAALEALEKAQAQIVEMGTAGIPSPSKKIGPVGDSNRIAAAKAEVLRLIEKNRQVSEMKNSAETPSIDDHVVENRTPDENKLLASTD